MIETYIKKTYQSVLVKPVARLLPTSTKPNTITLIAALLGIACGLAIALHQPIIAVVLLILSGYADTLDGCLAELTSQQTNLGCIFDIISDRLVEIAVILGLFFYQASTSRAVLSLLMLSSVLICITSFLIVSLFTTDTQTTSTGKSFLYSIGLIERAEAFIMFGLMILMPQYFVPLAITFTALVSLTAFLHIYRYRKFTLQNPN